MEINELSNSLMNKLSIFSAVFFIFALAMPSCSPSKKVTRIDEKQAVDLSGRWNDTDSRMVSEEMIRDGLSGDWISDFVAAKGRKRTVLVGIIRNKSSEHISTDIFIKDIEREFINSGKVKIVQGGEARDQLRKERLEQQDFASTKSAAEWGMELGADYILQGTVNSITDANSKQKLVFYQVDLELTHMESNEKVWLGSKKIKKVVK